METVIILYIIYLAILVAAIYLNYFIANQFYTIACDKGYTERKYLWISFWLGLVGYLLVVAMPVRKSQSTSKHKSKTTKSETSQIAEEDLNDVAAQKFEPRTLKYIPNKYAAEWERTLADLSTEEVLNRYLDEDNWNESYRCLCELELLKRGFDFGTLDN
ncbi:MAG: hypothetical protein IJ519_04690 [Clostridia bacterium]|nr:hypothetical protein [Clostridia bacterium]